MTPLFTIGIPTYNRAKLLDEALGYALAQTYSNTEILVVDNASDDSTPEVVAKYAGRVRYHRNESNIGVCANFQKAAELAQGEYFSFLQDDDVIFSDFASRAARALASRETPAYVCSTIVSDYSDALYQSTVVGPPFPLKWSGPETATIDGYLVALLSLFFNVAIPPTYAFRTDVLRKAMKHFPASVSLLGERHILNGAGWDTRIAMDPWVGGIHVQHANQLSSNMKAPEHFFRHWIAFVERFSFVWSSLPNDWEPAFRELLQTVPEEYRRRWFQTNQWWPERPDFSVPFRVREILLQSLTQHPAHRPSPMKDLAHVLTPPWIWNLGKRAFGRSY